MVITVIHGCAIQKFGGHYICTDARGKKGRAFRSKKSAIDFIYSQIKASKKWTFLDLKVSVNLTPTKGLRNMNHAPATTSLLLWPQKIWSAFLRLLSQLTFFRNFFNAGKHGL